MRRNFLRRFCTALLLSALHLSGPTNAGDHQDSDIIQGEKTAFACQGTVLHLECEASDEVIKVTRANYGRFSIAVCNDKSMTSWSVNCYSPKAKEVFVTNCNNFSECDISAEDFDFGPNLCPDTERYLEASYVCLKSSGPQNERHRPDSRTSLNTARRKPLRRVPITAPPRPATTPASTASTTSTTFSTISSTTSVMNTTSSGFSSTTPNPKLKAAPVFYEVSNVVMCDTINQRGILWPSTPAGSTAVQPCIKGSASWHCTSHGQWAKPDLSRCQSKKWEDTEVTTAFLDTINLYGGDILPLLDHVAALTDQFLPETYVRALMRTLSSLLEPRFDTAWKDLSEQSLTSQVARKFMEVTENLAEAVMINSDVNEEAFVFSTPFIYFSILTKTNREKASISLPPRFFHQNYSGDEFKERSLDSAVASSTVSIHPQQSENFSVAVISYSGLFLNDTLKTQMPIISIQTVPKWPLTQIRLTLPPSPDLFCHSIESQRQCDVAKWKNGSRECVCHGLARYSFAYGQEHQLKVLEQDGQTLLEEAMTTTMIVIVAVSSSLLVASLLSAALLVIYCRRVKIRDSKNNWENNSEEDRWRSKGDSTSVHTSSTLLGRASVINEAASIIPPARHYESHLHATLGPTVFEPKNNQGSSTWRRLLSTILPSSDNHQIQRQRPLTLGHHHHHRLNAENTLRLEAHRQLFQFNDYHTMHHQDNDQSMILRAHRSNEYYASGVSSESCPPPSNSRGVLQRQNMWSEDDIYQVPLEHQQRDQIFPGHLLNYDSNSRGQRLNSEDLWQVQHAKKMADPFQESLVVIRSNGNYKPLPSRPNSQHIYVDLDSSTSSFSSEAQANFDPYVVSQC